MSGHTFSVKVFENSSVRDGPLSLLRGSGDYRSHKSPLKKGRGERWFDIFGITKKAPPKFLLLIQTGWCISYALRGRVSVCRTESSDNPLAGEHLSMTKYWVVWIGPKECGFQVKRVKRHKGPSVNAIGDVVLPQNVCQKTTPWPPFFFLESSFDKDDAIFVYL